MIQNLKVPGILVLILAGILNCGLLKSQWIEPDSKYENLEYQERLGFIDTSGNIILPVMGQSRLGLSFILEDLIGYDDPLDLAGTFVNGEHPGIPVKAFHRVILGKSVTTVHLDGPGCDLVDHFRGKQLGNGCFPGIGFFPVF